MSLSDAYVRAACDKCGYEEEVELTALAMHGSYDMRNVNAALRRDRWTADGDRHICPECVENALDEEEEAVV